MKNKKGFTLIEVLCVIAILAVITTIASSSIINLTNKSKENLYCTKLELIKSAAKSYGSSYEYELNNSTTYFNNHKSLTITVDDLVKNGNFSYDKDETVSNPLNDESLNDLEIIIYLENNQINVYIEDNNIC